MMLKKKVVLSFDYELFFGDRSGTVWNTLIEPTNQLLDAMDSVGLKGNFFVDWQMLKYLKEEGTERTEADYNLIVEQLKDIVRRGHRIELHIHPHWVDAKYIGDGTWDFSEFRHYSLNTFSEDEIMAMFKEGAELLTSVARQVDPIYKLVAFRAGGWAVQPFDKLKSGLLSSGIFLDSSVMPGISIKCDNSECDFSLAPNLQKGWYRFNSDVCVEERDGLFIEVPITRARKGIFLRVLKRLTKSFKYDFTSLTDGTHERRNSNPDIWKSTNDGEICSFSKRPSYVIPLLILEDNKNLFCFIDHPKDLTKYTCKNIKLLSKVATSVLYKDILEEI